MGVIVDEQSEPTRQQWNTDYPGGTAQVPTGDPWDTAGAAGVGHPQSPRVAPAIAAGIVAAIAATAAWYFIVALSGWQIGLLAVGVGLVVGLAMRWAAGGVGGLSLQIPAVVLTLLSMFVAEFYVARKFIGDFFVSQGETEPLALFIPVSDMVSLVVETVKEDPVTLLFWVIAVVAAWRTTQATPEQQFARNTGDHGQTSPEHQAANPPS